MFKRKEMIATKLSIGYSVEGEGKCEWREHKGSQETDKAYALD